jgi:aspartate/methionine/tyrosine aminotransferase
MMEAQGRSIINLVIGQPDFPTLDNIVAAAQKALADEPARRGRSACRKLFRRLSDRRHERQRHLLEKRAAGGRARPGRRHSQERR